MSRSGTFCSSWLRSHRSHAQQVPPHETHFIWEEARRDQTGPLRNNPVMCVQSNHCACCGISKSQAVKRQMARNMSPTVSTQWIVAENHTTLTSVGWMKQRGQFEQLCSGVFVLLRLALCKQEAGRSVFYTVSIKCPTSTFTSSNLQIRRAYVTTCISQIHICILIHHWYRWYWGLIHVFVFIHLAINTITKLSMTSFNERVISN